MEWGFGVAAGNQEYFGDRNVKSNLSGTPLQKLEYKKDHFFSLFEFYSITQNN